MAAGKSHQVEVVRLKRGTLIRISGTLDETFQSSTFPPEHREAIAIDLDKVVRISSFGVREWLNAVNSLKTEYSGFVRVRPMMVSQFNMVSGFEGRGQLISIYLPYVCTSCSKAFEILVDLRLQPAHALVDALPEGVCPDCGSPGEFDDLPEAYFEFALSQPIPQPPPGFDDLAAGREETGSKQVGRSRVRKEIIGALTLVTVNGPLLARALKRAIDGVEGRLLLNLTGAHIAREALPELNDLFAKVAFDLIIAGAPLSFNKVASAWPRARWQSTVIRATCLTHGPQELTLVGPEAKPQCNSCPALLALDADVATELESLKWVDQPQKYEELLSARGGTNAPPLDIGRLDAVLAGRYQVVRRLAFGGMAEVLLAKQVAVGGFEKFVVLKRILPQHAANPEFLNLFLREARLSSRIVHPNVVQVLDVVEQGGEYFMVMEFVDGQSLRNLVRQAVQHRTHLSVNLVVKILAELAGALAAAHEHRSDNDQLNPIVHRDLSPDNAMLSKQGHVKLTDFGLAKSATSLSMTPTSNVRGKLAYLAPELLTDTSPSTETLIRADIYALGVIAYVLLTRNQPFRRDTEAQTLFAVIENKPPDLRKLRPDLPNSLIDLVNATMSKDITARPKSARALADALLHIMSYENLAISQEHVMNELNELAATPQPLKQEAATEVTDQDLLDNALTPPEVDVDVVIEDDADVTASRRS